MPITACGLTGLALLVGNIIKTQNHYMSPNFWGSRHGQVRVETGVIPATYFRFYTVIKLYILIANDPNSFLSAML